MLKGCWCIGQPKVHHNWFEEAPTRSKSSLPLVTFFDANIIETPANIQLGEVACAPEIDDQFGDEGEWVAVLDSHCVEHAIILAQPEGAILLLDEKHWQL